MPPCSDKFCTRRACVTCCNVQLCLLHVSCTKHALHPSLWRVDKGEQGKQQKPASAFMATAVAALERELEEAGAVAAAAALAATAPALAVADTAFMRKRKFTPGGEEDVPVAFLPRLPLPAAGVEEEEEEGEVQAGPSFGALARATREAARTAAERALRRVAVEEGRRRVGAGGGLVGGQESEEEGQEGEEGHVGRDRGAAFRMPRGRGAETAPAPAPPVLPRPPLPALEERYIQAQAERKAAAPSLGTRAAVVSMLATALREGLRADGRGRLPALAGTAGDVGSALAQRTRAEAAAPLTLGDAALSALAGRIEVEMYARDGPNRGEEEEASEWYRDRARDLLVAFRHPSNTFLRQAVIAGVVAPGRLAAMDAAALAPPEAQAARTAAEGELIHGGDLEAAAPVWREGGAEELCPSCGAVGTSQYLPLSDTRDIRKAEIWGGASNDEAVVRVRCSACGSTWRKA
jgi:hypothetical protein